MITTTTAANKSTNLPPTQPRMQTMSASQKPPPPTLRTSTVRSTEAATSTPPQGKVVTPTMAAPPIPKPLVSPTTSQSAPPSAILMTASKAPPPLSISAGPLPTSGPAAESVGPSPPTADPRVRSPSVHSPLANATAGDRLAPIRAAKAALQGPPSAHESSFGVNSGVVNGDSGPQGVQDFRMASRSLTPQQPRPVARSVHPASSQPSQSHANVYRAPQDVQRLGSNLPPRPRHSAQQTFVNYVQDSFGKPHLLTEETSANDVDARNSTHRPNSPLFYRDSHSQSPVSQRAQPPPHSFQQQSGGVQGHGMNRPLPPPPPPGPSLARAQYPPSSAYVPHVHAGANTLPPRPPPEVQRAATLPYPTHRLPPSGPYAESDRRGSGPERRQSLNGQWPSPAVGPGAYDHDPSDLPSREWDRDRMRDRDWNYPPPSRPRADRPPGFERGRGG
ncbi:hypothetical protein EDC04DRAFT_1974344 [Pisolithus marmoratus]|nr:hypothetical protein EDC04DRAFT_1974344 [Pisolithus marmoratus]